MMDETPENDIHRLQKKEMKIVKVLQSANLSILISYGQVVCKLTLAHILVLIVKLDQVMWYINFY